MKRLLVRFSELIVLAMLLPTPLHAADQIRIVHGTLFQPLDQTSILSVSGTSGLRIIAAFGSATHTPTWKNCYYYGCQPGVVVSLREYFSFPDSGQLTLHEQTYSLPEIGMMGDFQLLVDGEFVVPDLPPGRDTAQVSVPFVASGFFRIPSPLDPTTYDVFELVGSGVATVTIAPNSFGEPGLEVQSVSFDFLPRGNTVR